MIWNLFKIPSAEELAKNSLETAKREMLTHEASANYHKKMLEHYAETYRSITERLKTF
jgi:hypothetical protein